MNEILVGDALARLKDLPSESVDCCITSPPYWGLRDYGVEGQIGLERTYPEYVAKLTAVFGEVRRILKPEGTLWLNLGDCYYSGDSGGYRTEDHRWENSPKQRSNRGNATGVRPNRMPQEDLKAKDMVGIPWRVAFALQDDGWWLRRDIIWAKRSCMPESVTDRPSTAHEYMFCLGKTFILAKSYEYYYDAEAIREPDAGQDHKRNKTSELDRTQPGASPHKGIRKAAGRAGEGRNKRSVWFLGPEPTKEAHFATYPQKLVEPCVLAGCPPGGVVLDPFIGSGTTGLVALKLGRSFIGIELNPAYAKIAEGRVWQEKHQARLA